MKATRSKVFAAGKKKGEEGSTTAAAELTTARERITELEGEVAELTAKTPDFAAKEQALKDKHAKELQKRDEALQQKDAAVKAALRRVARAKLRDALTKAAEDGTRVDPDYADDRYMERFDDRLVIGDDLSEDVLQLGESTAYDAASVDAKLALLASDIRKQIAPRFILANADTGAGITNGSTGGTGGYDPVKAGQAMAAQTKGDGKTQNLALT